MITIQLQDIELLDALRDFVLAHPDPEVTRFEASIRNWGDEWRALEACHLPAAELLAEALDASSPQTRGQIELFAAARRRLHWEQSYRKQDGLVPEAMLENYAFAEIIGQNGPFVSDRIRAGIAIWGPHIHYPRHRHQAEEVYIVLAGEAEFSVAGQAPGTGKPGDVIAVPRNRSHGFHTTDQVLAVYYLWQAGDLRQISELG